MLKSARLLVTGSKGLIGSLLVKQLGLYGIQVIECDNRFPLNHVGYADTRDPCTLKDIIASCQGIVHLAAVSRVVWGEKNPQLCFDVNITGTKNILEIAYQLPHKPWVIFASSREVYGQQLIFPVAENAPLNPLNTYACSKLEGEKLINSYRELGLKTAILRFSSVYGSTHDYFDRVIPAFCLAAIKNNILRIDGFNNSFDFTHVKDTVAGIICVIQKLMNGTADLPPLHLTTGTGTSLLKLALLIESILGKPIKYQEAPARTYDVHKFYGDTTHAKAILDWQPRISLQQGITDLIKEYQSQVSSLKSEI